MRHNLRVLVAAIILGSGNVAAAEEATERPLSIWEQETFFGDWHGLRTALSNQGVDLTLQYIGEGFGVLSGGIHDRGSYEGRLEFSADVNLEKFMGWRGASTHVTVFNIHDGGWNVADNVGSLADSSNIDAVPRSLQGMEKRSHHRIRDLNILAAFQGLVANEIECARISMMARKKNTPYTLLPP